MNRWQRILKFLSKKYRLVILNDATFGEKFSLRLTPFGIILGSATFTLLLTTIGLVLFKILGEHLLINGLNQSQSSSPENRPNPKELIGIIGVVLAFTVVFLLSYLNRTNNKRIDQSQRLSKYDRSLYYEVLKKLEYITKGGDKIDQDKLTEIVDRSVKEYLENELLKKIDERYSKEAIRSKKMSKLYDTLRKSLDRLNAEIISTARRANLNLVIGIVATVIAITGFTYMTLTFPLGVADLMEYFLPRIFLALFVQVFAYFFLRLYKRGMEEIKYYQNELTNVESKISAIEYSLLVNDKDEIHEVIVREMMRNERNGTIPANGTNHFIEMEKLNDNRSIDSMINFLKNLRSKP